MFTFDYRNIYNLSFHIWSLIKHFQEQLHDNYLPDELDLDCIVVRDNFVSFSNTRDRNSFIYSVNDEKPNFINCPSPDEKHVYVEKITDNWHYACVRNRFEFR